MRNFFNSSFSFSFSISCHFILKKVIEWINSEGENSLTKYGALSLECGNTIRDEEQEFEKYYFISMVSCVVNLFPSISFHILMYFLCLIK
jgi:hypothetical protein